jgi:uncharacterized DUF497 family protein
MVHTYFEIADDLAVVRMISAWRPTKLEVRQYEEGTA